jgi:class 3 adenylate cyclase
MPACSNCGAALSERARFCSECGAPQASAAPLSDERKLATVVFADLVGSTALADREDPERVRVLQGRFFAAMAEEIESRGGTVEKFAGDAVMAVFGAPAALEDHAERALHAALAMREHLSGLFDGRIEARIGVSTGEVVSGPAREESAFVTGDSVNVGARLEQAAAPGEILAAERTVAAARGAFEFGDRRLVEAKGKSSRIACRPVVRALTLTRPRGVRGLGLHEAFVGREGELDLLHATFRRAVSLGEPYLVTIVGEPGVGKSRLVGEFRRVVDAGEGSPRWLSGRCLPYGDGITYWPLAEVVKEHFGILESDRPEQILDRLGEERRILGLALGLEIAGELHPLQARERLREGFVAFVEELAGDLPLVLLVEDVHWADEALLELLQRVLRDCRAPMVLVTTARPELFDRGTSFAAAQRNATAIRLDPLPASATSRLLDELLAAPLPDELRELVVARAEGNPFFVEELVGALVDAGVLVKESNGWVAGDIPAGFSVPDSVHAVLSARIDRLPATEKAALQAASVVGRVFWRGPVVHLLAGAEPDFELLEERDFIRRHGRTSMAGELEYGIKHALTREVAYASIPKARRGRIHAAFAEWLESADQAKDEYASLLAYHFSEAVRPDDVDLVWGADRDEHRRLRAAAVRWLRRAGVLARGRYELEEALELFHRAAELTPDDRERALLWAEVGRTQALRYDGDAMRAALLRSVEGPLDDRERADTYSFLAFQASIRSAMWSIRLNRHLIESWVERALELAEDGSEAQARALLARVNVEPGAVADSDLERVVRAVENVGDDALGSYALGARSQAAFSQTRFQEAAAWSDRRLDLVARLDDPDHLCEAYEAGVPAYAAMGRFGDAGRLIELHDVLAARLSAHHRVHAVSLRLELAEVLADWNVIVETTDRAAELVARNLDTPCVRNPRDLLLCAAAHACLGDDDRARELERDAARIAPQGYDAYLSEPRLRLALERGDREAAEALVALPIERAFVWGPAVFSTRLDALVALHDRSAIERDAAALAREATILQPFALRALGYAANDDALLSRADELFQRFGLDWHRAQTERLIAGL